MLIVGFKSGREIKLDVELISMKTHGSKLTSVSYDYKNEDDVVWFDLGEIDYIYEINKPNDEV